MKQSITPLAIEVLSIFGQRFAHGGTLPPLSFGASILGEIRCYLGSSRRTFSIALRSAIRCSVDTLRLLR